MKFDDDTTIGEAREMMGALVQDGTTCPVCDQHAQVYKRKINAGMARSLIAMYRAKAMQWQHVPTTVGGKSREEGKLAYWGLVEEEKVLRPDGGRAGYWRVTQKGWAFLTNTLKIDKYVYVYNGKPLSFEGPQVTIEDALGDGFDYKELMYG